MLKEQIEARMKAKNLSIAQLERNAGLKIHAVRNILKGRIKKPSAETLVAIANVLECSIIDFIRISAQELKRQNREKVLLSFEELELLQSCLEAVANFAKDEQLSISVDDFLHLVSKVYAYSMSDEPKTLDPKFLKWTMKNFLSRGKGCMWRNDPGL